MQIDESVPNLQSKGILFLRLSHEAIVQDVGAGCIRAGSPNTKKGKEPEPFLAASSPEPRRWQRAPSPGDFASRCALGALSSRPVVLLHPMRPVSDLWERSEGPVKHSRRMMTMWDDIRKPALNKMK